MPALGWWHAAGRIPLTDVDALRNVQFVMMNGMVFKKDGVMTSEKFFHPGPARTPNGRWTR
ncbi:MAG TPA: hypothetical protein VLN44_01700 [Pyrinomonadaceae bacterium]|nr:hypothetical protein [Pyrinomonadaceae bacterium]